MSNAAERKEKKNTHSGTEISLIEMKKFFLLFLISFRYIFIFLHLRRMECEMWLDYIFSLASIRGEKKRKGKILSSFEMI